MINDEDNESTYSKTKLGTNLTFKNFMQNYFLLGESVAVRYKTKAAEYYRARVLLY